MKTPSLLLPVLIAVFLIGPARATTVAVKPNTQNAVVGSPVQVDLMISGVNSGTVSALGAFDLDVTFDSSLMTFESATFGTNLDVSGLGATPSVRTQGGGTVNLFEVSLDTAADLVAHQPSIFNLATLTFNAVATGNSVINIGINSLADAKGESLAASVVPGNILVSAVPEPHIYMLILAGLGLLGYRDVIRRFVSLPSIDS
jgi:hypothetical protein